MEERAGGSSDLQSPYERDDVDTTPERKSCICSFLATFNGTTCEFLGVGGSVRNIPTILERVIAPGKPFIPKISSAE